MLRTLKRRIYRNRRRALICFAGFFEFSILKSIDNGTLGDLGMSLFVAIALGLIMTVLLGTLALINNKWRALMEITAVASILIALFGLLAPALETTLPPWAHIGLVWAATFGFGSFYGGTLLDTYTRREKVTLHGRARSTLPVETVWTGLFGLPAEVAQRYDADDVMVYEPVADEPNTYRVVERLPDGIGQIEEHQTYLLRDAPHNVRHTWRVPSAPDGTPFCTGLIEATLTPTRKGGTRLAVTTTVDVYSARMALYAWVDDHAGRTQDDKLASLETRAAAHPATHDLGTAGGAPLAP